MLVVMPEGYGFPDVADRMADQFDLAKQRSIMDSMGQILINEIVPQVERSYRVIRSLKARAIAGCSMGGAQSLYFGLHHPEIFGTVASFSGAFIMYSGGTAKWFPEVLHIPNQKLLLACGTEDFLLGSNRVTTKWLETHGAKPEVRETPGGHTWQVWRRELAHLAPSLFR